MPPLAVFVTVVSAIAFDRVDRQESLKWGYVVGTLLSMFWLVIVWRPFIPRTLRRASAVGMLAILVLTQVLVWQPAWAASGCADDYILRQSQSLGLGGLWWIVTPLIWWGVRALYAVPAPLAACERRSRTMSPAMLRLTIGLGLIPFLPGVFWFVAVFADDVLGLVDAWVIFTAYQFCAVLAVAIWIALWFRSIPRTGPRRTATVLLLLAVLFSPAVIWIGVPAGGFVESLCAMFPVFMLAAMFAGTALLWRAPDVPNPADTLIADHLTRVLVCPSCGYSLRGLREVRCPECGWTSDLDEVVARSVAALDPD